MHMYIHSLKNLQGNALEIFEPDKSHFLSTSVMDQLMANCTCVLKIDTRLV